MDPGSRVIGGRGYIIGLAYPKRESDIVDIVGRMYIRINEKVFRVIDREMDFDYLDKLMYE